MKSFIALGREDREAAVKVLPARVLAGLLNVVLGDIPFESWKWDVVAQAVIQLEGGNVR